MPTSAEDRIAIQDIAYRYAIAVDQRDYLLFDSIITADGKIFGKNFCFNGIDEVKDGMRAVEQHKRTFHAVHNHTITIEGDLANGEVYCVASHIYDREDIEHKLDWGIRYQDKYLRTDHGWRLVDRELILDWTQDLPTGI
jgi:hypothetical protein